MLRYSTKRRKFKRVNRILLSFWNRNVFKLSRNNYNPTNFIRFTCNTKAETFVSAFHLYWRRDLAALSPRINILKKADATIQLVYYFLKLIKASFTRYRKQKNRNIRFGFSSVHPIELFSKQCISFMKNLAKWNQDNLILFILNFRFLHIPFG